MSSPSTPPALTRLLTRFRRRRPLRAGSLLITLFGDAIAPRGGAVSLASLIRLAAPFGVAERLVRTSVARLAQDGWLVSHREGRTSEYALTAEGAAQFAEATERIYSVATPRWDGRWTTVLFPDWPADGRERIRHALHFAGFGEPLVGVFLHPNIDRAHATALLQDLDAADFATVLVTEPPGGATARLVDRGWNTGDLDRRYRAFVQQFEPLRHEDALDPAAAFLLRTLLIHEYRRIHLRDPGLPPDLLPAGWAGATAQELCRGVYRNVFAAAETHLDALAARHDGPLPPPDAAAYRRFGGLPGPRR